MTRRRLAVALLVPQPLATEVDGLRRACGDPRLGRIAAHITLVPPVNIAEGRVAEALDHCRLMARSTPVLGLRLEAPATFAPATPLAWLAVSGDLDELGRLRGRLNAGPLTRPEDHPFVPHVTISAKVGPDRLAAILAALTNFCADCTIGRLHLLENRQLSDGRWGWVPLADAGFGRPAVVGAGGLALELSVGAVLEPGAEALGVGGLEGAGGVLIVTGRRDGAVVGVATGLMRGGLAVLGGLIVGRGHRGEGIGSHVLARFLSEAIERGCDTASYTARAGDPVLMMCRRRGWSDAGAESADTADDAQTADTLVTVMRVLAAR